MHSPIAIAPEVREALAAKQPVVALETAVLTHGLPRALLARVPACAAEHGGWNSALPANLALSMLLEAAVRRAGAVPATIGMLDGVLVAGLDAAQLARLGSDPGARKLSTRDLGPAAAQHANGGTTVAATLAACALAGIRVFATGGIGGVHRGWTLRPDVSADLAALARTPVAVISAGAKSILDLPATVEALDALGVPVLGVGTPWFPRFLSPGAAPLRVSAQVRDAAEAAAACRAHWLFAPGCGVLVANPPPARFAIATEAIDAIIEQAIVDAETAGISGPDTTPYLLERVQRATGGQSVEANIAVLAANAALGAQLARELIAVG